MFKGRPLLRLTMALSLSAGALVHAADDFLLSRFGEYVDALRTQADVPGLAVAVVGATDVTWEGMFGHQDVERNLPVRFDTPFQLDDTTQAIVGSLAMQCASEGKISLDDPVSKFMPASAGRQRDDRPAADPHERQREQPQLLVSSGAARADCGGRSPRARSRRSGAGVAGLLDVMSMFDSVPGSDVVRLTPPAEGFTAQDLDDYARRSAAPGDALLGRRARPRDAVVLRRARR